MKSVIGIDPGSKKSALVHWDSKVILNKGIFPNDEMLDLLEDPCKQIIDSNPVLAIETMISIPAGAGKSVCDTIFWAGRFYQSWPSERVEVPVGNVRMALCGTMRSDNSDVRKALIYRFDEPGSQKNPNPITYGLGASGYHLWRAFAVAVVHMDHLEFQAKILE